MIQNMEMPELVVLPRLFQSNRVVVVDVPAMKQLEGRIGIERERERERERLGKGYWICR